MNFLHVMQACTVVRLNATQTPGVPLVEQALPHLSQSPFVVLDAEGIVFGSMQIGELVNLIRTFDERWDGTPHRLALINLSPQAQQVFVNSKLDQVFPIYESLADALNAFSNLSALREKMA